MTAAEFQCPDPFRRMVVTWDGRHTMPCCQGFTLEIDGGPVVPVPGYPLMKSLQEAWAERELRAAARGAPRAHLGRPGFAGEPICQSCAVTKLPTRLGAAAARS